MRIIESPGICGHFSSFLPREHLSVFGESQREVRATYDFCHVRQARDDFGGLGDLAPAPSQLAVVPVPPRPHRACGGEQKTLA